MNLSYPDYINLFIVIFGGIVVLISCLKWIVKKKSEFFYIFIIIVLFYGSVVLKILEYYKIFNINIFFKIDKIEPSYYIIDFLVFIFFIVLISYLSKRYRDDK